MATFTSGQVFDDGIIDPRDTRTVLGIALSATLSAEVQWRSKRLAYFGCEPHNRFEARLLSINKILIANRGEIARRIMRTCRDMGIATVAVCSDVDRDALFVRESDEVVPLDGLPPGQAYLDIPAILDAARKTGCDAIHPGYGFLSENPALGPACQEAGIRFIGPPAEVIEAMGSKIEAKRRTAGGRRAAAAERSKWEANRPIACSR